MKTMTKFSTLFVLLCMLLIASNFFIVSCPDDDDDDEYMTSPTATPTNTPTPLTYNDIFNFTVTEESGSTVYVSVDYYYTSDHGSAWIGAYPLDENGNNLYSGFTPQSIHSGYGSATIKVQYLGETAYTSQEIAVFTRFFMKNLTNYMRKG